MKEFLIDVPPPTISGNLHIGHIFSYTQGDIIAKYQKYQNKRLIYPFCFDNNGIPTGKLANSKGIKGTREIIDFSINKAQEYKDVFNKAGIHFENQEYYTYNELTLEIVYKVFNLLKNRGIIYKKETEYLYSEKLKTSISQSELNEEGFIERTGEVPIIKKGIGYFINILDYLPQIQEMVDKINWTPLHKSRIDNWIKDVKWDWSISRERNFGIPIPDEETLTFDTWFISSLSPQISYSSYVGEVTLNCPVFDIRYQSHDIIRTWAFYTIAMSYFLKQDIPFHNLIVTGHVIDNQGNKLSKSLGNTTNPLLIIDRYGINGIRHWASSNTLGKDIQLDEEELKKGWRIANKFINAKKFVSFQIENQYIGEDDSLFEVYLNYKKDILDSF